MPKKDKDPFEQFLLDRDTIEKKRVFQHVKD